MILSTLYPFVALMVSEHADLQKSFYLLRRQPLEEEEVDFVSKLNSLSCHSLERDTS